MSNNESERIEKILLSPSYRLVENDSEFLAKDDLRPVRMQLELLKPELTFKEEGIKQTFVVFGGTQIIPKKNAEDRLEMVLESLKEHPDNMSLKREEAVAGKILEKSKYYDDALEFGRLLGEWLKENKRDDCALVTGGGPGIMEAANRGAWEAGIKSVGLNITLPREQAPNSYIDPHLCFRFRYFGLRKMHFLLRAGALVIFPGGFGTLDELFDALTLRQTNRMQKIPIILYGRDFWNRVINVEVLADEGTISDRDLELIQYADSPERVLEIIKDFHEEDLTLVIGKEPEI
ncbi:MAG: TIGR00730 family Rossman fold protein [Acidobacteriota bacterium]